MSSCQLGRAAGFGSPSPSPELAVVESPSPSPELSVVESGQRGLLPDVHHPLLATISEANPAARGLALLEAIAVGGEPAVQWPLNDFVSVRMARSTGVNVA